MKSLKIVLLFTLTIIAGVLIAPQLPSRYTYGVEAWYARLGQPEFNEPFESFTHQPIDEVSTALRAKGHAPKCYGNLTPEEKISKRHDFTCDIYTNSAYGGIPATHIMFIFQDGTLTHVRVEFPSSSFEKVQDYAFKHMQNYKRADTKEDLGSDGFGNKLMGWTLPKGSLVAGTEEVEGQPTYLLWSSNQFSFKLK
ncbi:MAG: hypothetical protein ABWY06_11525 [Pseudomonas sp.]|uniref:hypothetical protein n=1 Tax=Pseudomonas sp. TaxID=306 RepID=UPI003396FF5F